MIWPFSKKKTVASNSDKEVQAYLSHLGMDLTTYGFDVVRLSKESGYSPAETSSLFAMVTIASDMKAADYDMEKMMRITVRGHAILQCLKDFKDQGLIREEIWKNDTTAIANIIDQSPDTEEWIEQVLSDPVISKEPIAVSRV